MRTGYLESPREQSFACR